MSDAESETRQPVRHPSAFEPAVLAVTVVSSVVGAIIGVQIITTLGITPNTAIIGVLAAIAISRIPVHVFSRFRSIHRQNLVQTTISTATFAAANSLLLPIGIPVLLNRPDLVVPMLIGATLAMVIDLLMLYWLFDSRLFAATNAWPPGFAASEAVKAGDEGGKRARLLVYGGGIGVLGAWLGIPMSAFGVAFIGNIFALAMFGVGLVIRGYSPDVLGIDIAAQYIPHGMMIGAGVVALGQAVYLVVRAGRSRLRAEAGEQSGDADAPQNPPSGHAVTDETHTRSDRDLAKGIGRGAVLFLLAGLILAAAGGLAAQMPAGAFVGWMAFAAVSCIAAEFIVGLSAMHSGWFPAFATSLTFLVLGILMGFPPGRGGVARRFRRRRRTRVCRRGVRPEGGLGAAW